MSEMIDGYTASKIKEFRGDTHKTGIIGMSNEYLKENIQLHRLIGEMKGSLEMMLIFYREHMNVTQISALGDLLKRYEEFFKTEGK